MADLENIKDGDYNDLYLSLAKGERKSNHGYDIEESRELAQKLADVSSPPGNSRIQLSNSYFELICWAGKEPFFCSLLIGLSLFCLKASTGNYVEEQAFIDVLGSTSFAQLVSVFACFADITGKDIKEVVEPRSKGNLQRLVLTMSKNDRTPSIITFYLQQSEANFKVAFFFVFSSPLCKEQASLLCRADPLRPVGHRDPRQLAHLLRRLTVRGRHGRDQGRVLEALRRDPVQGHQARRQWQLRESPAAAGRQGLSCRLDSRAKKELLIF